MAGTIKMFGVRVVQMTEGDLMTIPPVVKIVMDNHPVMADGTPIVGNDLINDEAIDTCVKLIKEDLDRVAGLAKRQLKRARERTDEIVASRVENRRELGQ